jgi:hypothetical protein
VSAPPFGDHTDQDDHNSYDHDRGKNYVSKNAHVGPVSGTKDFAEEEQGNAGETGENYSRAH